ncbi:hypothetical protein [Clavibacter sp. Sh2088]|uniref:hypothetical protein n=1 Tax=Clavibacter sp. Sh2088 TaxID=3397676 RepID=UPI0039E17386
MSHSHRRHFVVGGIVLAVAGLLSGAGLVLDLLTAANPDANIGAGILVLAGLPVALIGLLLLLVDLVLHIRARASRGTASR